jgi:hypothetical protein
LKKNTQKSITGPLNKFSSKARSAITELGEKRRKNKQTAETLKAAKSQSPTGKKKKQGLIPLSLLHVRRRL